MSSELFAEKLKRWTSHQTDSNRYVSDEEHAEMIRKLLAFQREELKPCSSKDYRWIKNLAVAQYGSDAYKLVRKAGGLEVLPASRLFEVIHEAHLISGHAGRDKLCAILKQDFWNVTYDLIKMYLSTCQQCEEKRPRPRKHLVVAPMISDAFSARAQVDLINFESEPDGDFKYILTYQDHLTKFVLLKAITSKRAAEVAICSTFSARSALQLFCNLTMAGSS